MLEKFVDRTAIGPVILLDPFLIEFCHVFCFSKTKTKVDSVD